jgi:hypothetical protein
VGALLARTTAARSRSSSTTTSRTKVFARAKGIPGTPIRTSCSPSSSR